MPPKKQQSSLRTSASLILGERPGSGAGLSSAERQGSGSPVGSGSHVATGISGDPPNSRGSTVARAGNAILGGGTAVGRATAEAGSSSGATSGLPVATGHLKVHQPRVSLPVPFVVGGETRDAADDALPSNPTFAEEAAMLRTLKAWTCKATLHGEDWDVQVRGISAPGGAAAKTVLFVHGLGPDRCAGFFAKFWLPIHEAGYHIIAVDMPGHGRSSTKALPARGAQDGELLLAIIAALTDQQPGQISCFTDAGGARTFIRAYCLRPEVFSGHHFLVNPILAEIPDSFKRLLEKEGTDLYVAFADGWGKTDQPFKIATAAVFLMFLEEIGDRVTVLFHRAPDIVSVTQGLKFEKPPEYLYGKSVGVSGWSRTSSFYCLVPCAEFAAELVTYLDSARREPVRDVGPSAPSMTALEMGEVNDNFRVFVRVRPYLRREEQAGSKPCVQVEDVADFPRTPPPQRIRIRDPSGTHHAEGANFVFDRVFQPATQDEIFGAVGAPLVDACLQGINVTMFAYGQTGTGKTFTMEGPPSNEGLMHKAIHQLFQRKQAAQTVYFQYVQLYNSDFKDLLDPESSKALAVEEGKKFMKVRGASISTASSAGAMLAEVAKGAQYRASGKTNMNDASSRSHAILSVMLSDAEPENGTVMHLVDLAGSERVKRSGATGAQFTEAANINQALSTLGRVVVGLIENDGKRAAHIAYKDNPLTHLLKSGIGGNSRTALICCITAAEDSLSESLNTLRFALQASHVKNEVADKAKKDSAAAAAEKIAESGNALSLSPGNTAEVPIAGGPIVVRGSWGAEGTVVFCVHDFGHDGSQFDRVISLLGDEVRILAPDFEFTTEREDSHAAVHSKIKALIDWLGVVKPVFFGRDFGAVISASFKVNNPTRAGPLVLQNLHQNYNVEGYKAKMKANPNFVMVQWMDCWTWIGDIMEADKSKQVKNVKGLKGKVALLWPCHFKGAPDPKLRNSGMAVLVAKALRTSLIDTYGYSEEQIVEEVRKVLR